MEQVGETDEELKQRILSILDLNDRVESYYAFVAILNNDPKHPSRYYVGEGGQFNRVMKELKHSD